MLTFTCDLYSGTKENVFLWNNDLRMFTPYQSVPVIGPFDVTYFRIDFSQKFTFDCFIIPNSFDGRTSRLNSEILCWDKSTEQFILKQSIKVRNSVIILFCCCCCDTTHPSLPLYHAIKQPVHCIISLGTGEISKSVENGS